MDSNNFNIFGPYADKFITKSQDILPKSALKSSTRSQRKQVQQPVSVTSSIKKTLFTSSTSTASTSRAAAPKTVPDWTSFHKKPASNFALPNQSKLYFRMNQAEERRRHKRTEVVTEKRNIDIASLKLTPAPAKIGTNKIPDMANDSDSASSGPVPPVKESRKQQLLSWKREKEEMAKNGPQKKPPFKSGPAQPIARPLKQSIPLNQPELPSERRVTRAMTKAHAIPQAPAFGINKNNKIENARSMAPPVNNSGNTSKRNAFVMKIKPFKAPGLDIQIDCREAVEPMVIDGHVEKSFTKEKENNAHDKAKAKTPNVAAKSFGGKASQIESENKPKVRKPKGMQFDATYIEYNDKFVKACSSLLACSTKWSEVLPTSSASIPEDVCCDIESSLGQAKLLMESKLPQFGELLYFYLSKHQDPGPILPGDLQGWWDVAVISIDNVLHRFDKLAELEKNAWIMEGSQLEEQKKLVGSGSTPRKLKGSGGPSSGGAKAKSNAKANSGLMAFLAEKRKKAAASKEMGETLSENSAKRSPSPDHQFEGGFFAIRSPAPFATPKQAARTPRATRSSVSHLSSSFQTHLQLTPGSGNGHIATRRLSNPKTPLMMLAVRKSMGQICKLGVNGVPLKEIPNGSTEALAPVFTSFPEEA